MDRIYIILYRLDFIHKIFQKYKSVEIKKYLIKDFKIEQPRGGKNKNFREKFKGKKKINKEKRRKMSKVTNDCYFYYFLG